MPDDTISASEYYYLDTIRDFSGARLAYNSARDQMEVDGEDVSDMDTSAEVLKQVKAMKKG
jgi:hypothetical protein